MATMAVAPTRRLINSSRGNSTYSCASIAIVQKARLGLPSGAKSCTSSP